MGRKREKQNRAKLFEYFPNEIFAEIFSYLNGVDAVFSFSNLNHRFQCLLYEYSQLFDFQSISHLQFNLLSKYHDTKLWKSLKISDDIHTPNQIEYFCQFYSLINDFPQLQSLSIINMNLKNKYTILSQLSSFTNLVSLIIEPICGEKMFPFDLPNLKRLVFDSCMNIDWIKNFTQLESIEFTTGKCYSHEKDLIWPITLKHLKFIFGCERYYHSILRSLVNLSSLITLEVYQNHYFSYYHPNGQSWENLIRSSLPLLKTLKLYFQFQYLTPPINHDDVIASFSTPFYINQRKWFIYHDIPNKIYPYHFIILNSLPFAFQHLRTLRHSFSECISSLSEDYKNNLSANICSNIKTLEVPYKNSEYEENFNRTNVVNLTLYVDFDFRQWINMLTKLRHLDIQYYMMSLNNFHLLLKNTPNLYSLNIKKTLLRTLTDNWNNTIICNYLSQKIRCLKFYPTYNHSHHFSKNEFEQIIRIFCTKCQHLSLSVQSPTDALLILQNMSQLHSLHVNITEKPSTTIDMIWLEKQQTKYNHSNCIIINDEQNHYFWL